MYICSNNDEYAVYKCIEASYGGLGPDWIDGFLDSFPARVPESSFSHQKSNMPTIYKRIELKTEYARTHRGIPMSDDGIVITTGTTDVPVPIPEQNQGELSQVESVVEDVSTQSAQPSENVDTHEEAVEESAVDSGESEVAPVALESDPSSVKKRINKMYQDKRQAEVRAQEAQRQMQMLQQELARVNQGQAPSSQVMNGDPGFPREPNENDPCYEASPKLYIKDYANYQRQLVVYEMRQQQLNNYQQIVETKYNEQLEKARGRYEDFDEKIDSLGSLPIANTPQVNELVASIKELDNSAEVAYYFANNHAEFMRLFNLPSRMAAIQLGRISEKLTGSPVQIRKTSPPPPKNLKGTGLQHQKKSINDLSIDDIQGLIRSQY